MKSLAAKIFVSLILLAGGIASLNSSYEDWPHAKSLGQRAVNVSAVINGVAALIALPGVLMRNRWGLWCALVWGLFAVAAASLATFYYGESGLGTSAVAGTGCLIGVAPVIWICRWIVKQRSDSSVG